MRRSDPYQKLPIPPASATVAEHIRLSVIRGDLLPGQKVPQDEIALSLGLSRMPVREALRQLEVEGFVSLIPNRGAVVRKLSIQDIRDVYQVRIELEGLAARLGARRSTLPQLEQLERLMDLMRGAVQSNDIYRLLELNKEFHNTCYESAENEWLIRLVRDLRAYSLRYRLFHAFIPDRLRESLHEHEAILQAFKAQDGPAAERHTKHNMQRTADVLIKYLDEHWGKAASLGTSMLRMPEAAVEQSVKRP